MRVALGIEYLGGQFHGWQTQQPGVRCIQPILEAALAKVAGHEVRVICAGRTDKGVNASQQIIHFECQAERPEKAWVLGTNAHLPDDVAVKWGTVVADDFHARFTALSRTYRYFILNQRARSALLNQQMTWYYHALDEEKMHSAAQLIIGEHDFSAFRAAECQASHARRNVISAEVKRFGDVLMFEVRANAFLMHMVRNFVGVLFEIGDGRKPVSWIEEVLAGQDRTKGGITAPPDGLYFVDVEYPEQYRLPKKPMGPSFISAFVTGERSALRFD